MNKLWTLTVLELRSLWGLNQYRWTRDPRAKNRCRLLAGVWIILLALAVSYVGSLVYGLCYLGLEGIVPAYLVMIASLLIFVVGFFQAGPMLFGSRGYDLLISMPVDPGLIPLSRFMALYGENLALALGVLLPGLGVYGLLTGPETGFYLRASLGLILLPAIPLAAASLVGTVVMALSSGMKHKSLVRTGLMLALVMGIFLLPFSMESMEGELTPELLSSLAGQSGELMAKVYPPAYWLGQGMLGSRRGLGLFLGASLALTAALVLLVSRNFRQIMGRLQTRSARHDYQIGALEHRSLVKALYIREARRYFSSSIYVTNTIIGPIMGCILAGAVCFGGLDAVQAGLPLDLAPLMPYAFGGIFCMMTTTAVSISMEGKGFWIVRSLPIPAKQLLDSKILLNLSLMAPFYLLGEVFLVIGLKPGISELLGLLLIPVVLMLFSVVVGITIDLKLHSFDWEKEEQVVKQSASSMLGDVAGLLAALLLGSISILLGGLVNGAAVAMLVVLTGLLYKKNNTGNLAEL